MFDIQIKNEQIYTESEVIDKKGLIHAINAFYNLYGEPDYLIIKKKGTMNEKISECSSNQ